MRGILETRVRGAEQLKTEENVRAAVLGLMRITLQHACVVLGEWIANTLRADPSKLQKFTGVDLKDFVAPADGELIGLLSELLVAVENLGWKSAGRYYWETATLSEPLKRLVGKSKANVETVLLAFVRERNDGVEGHGLPGGYDPEADVAVIRSLIARAAPFLPIVADDGETLLIPPLGGRDGTPLKTLKLYAGDPICYRRLIVTSAGKIRVEAQISRALLKREPVTVEVPNLLLELPARSSPEYSIFEPGWAPNWRPFVLIPDRLATVHEFTGRTVELASLEEWADDMDSRRCMVHGDGGMGKTTLVVEFLHRLLEGETEVKWRPELITFYTAKKTRWGLQGLEHISAQDVGVADVAVEIARLHSTKPLDRSWYDKSPKEVVQKLAGLQAQMRLKRDDHLIILDNTETMAKNDADIRALGSQINELSKHVGRVILTSRRREQIEAFPIQTESWSPEEGLEFLKKRGRSLKCQSIIMAGQSTLKGYSKALNNKPIALEVFAQAASAPGESLERSFERVQRMQRQDLGQFLYDDAWSRLAPEMRHVMLLMSRIGDVIDQYIIQLCCRVANVNVAAASEAIEESKGIGTVTKIQGILQVAFNPEFANYCAERTELLDGKTVPSPEDVSWIQKRYREFVTDASAQVRDRNTRAFVVPSARAAWKSFQDGNIDQAFEHYEAACSEDPDNGYLYDRFAYALFSQRRYDAALEKAKRATVLLTDEPEPWFTQGMVKARLGRASDAVKDLDRAESLGKPKHLCELQRAYAYVYSDRKDLESARECVERALRLAPRDRFLDKFASEATAFKNRWLRD